MWLARNHTLNTGGNNSNLGENVACAQPSVSQEEEEIQNSNFEHESSRHPREAHDEDDRKPPQKELKRSQKMRLRVGLRKSKQRNPHLSSGKTRKTTNAIFRKYISIGEDCEEHYDVIDMQIEAQRAVRRITDHQEIVKEYQKVVRAYNNFMKDYPWESRGGLMQDNCRLGDMLKDEKRKSQFKYELGRLMV